MYARLTTFRYILDSLLISYHRKYTSHVLTINYRPVLVQTVGVTVVDVLKTPLLPCCAHVPQC